MPAPSIPGVSTELVEEWDELADRVGADPFSRPGWIGSWVAGFGGGALEVFTVRRGPRLAAVVGLQRSSRGCLRSPTNAETPLFCPVAEDESAQAALAAKVAAGGPSRLVLGYLPAEGSALAVWRALFGAKGYRTTCRKVLSSPYLALSCGQPQGPAVSAKQRQELRRRRRRLEEHGPVAFDVRDGRQGLSELLEEAFRLEASGWKAEQGSAIAARREARRFYTEVAAWSAGCGILRLAFLRVGGTAIACDLSLEDRGVHYLLKTGYDPAYRPFAPGMLLRQAMIDRSAENGLRLYDFLGNADPWKLAWTTSCRDRLLLRCFAPGVSGFCQWAWVAHGRRLGGHLARKLRAR